MSNLWFLVSVVGAMECVRRMVAEGYPWTTIEVQCDRWADVLADLAATPEQASYGLFILGSCVLVSPGPGPRTVH